MNTQEFNEIVFDGMLKLAANEIFQEKISEFDALPDGGHEFSLQFVTQMKKNIKTRRKTEENGYKSIIAVSKRAAVVILVILSITCVGLLTVEAVRAELYKIYTTFFEKYIDISFRGENGTVPQQNQKINEVYLPSYIPDGFVEYEINSGTIFVYADYINSDNDVISYHQGLIENGFAIDGEDYIMRETSINGAKGQIYEYDKAHLQKKQYIIIWNDSECYYTLIGNAEIEELLKMACSLEVQK